MPVVIPLASGCSICYDVHRLLCKSKYLNYWITKVAGFSSDKTVIPLFILFSLWITGSTIVIFLAGLQQVPTTLYEAIRVDGGNSWHKLKYVTIPLVSPIIFFNTLLGFINSFQTFVQTAVLTPGYSQMMMGQPNNSGLLYVPYIYTKAFRFSRMGEASASAIILLLVIAILTMIFFSCNID